MAFSRTARTIGCLAMTLWLASPARPAEPIADDQRDLVAGLVFYEDFDAGGTSYLEGGLGYRYPYDVQYRMEGKFGSGYRFEPPYANQLPLEIAAPSADLRSFVAAPGAKLRVEPSAKWQNVPALTAAGIQGPLWETSPVEVTGLDNPHHQDKTLLASVYLRTPAQNVKVRLELADLVDATDWQTSILEAGKAETAKNPKAKPQLPMATKAEPTQAALTSSWQRVATSIAVDVRRPTQRLVFKLVLMEPDSATVEASALQLEQIRRFPDFKTHAGPWLPGGQAKEGNRIRLPLHVTGLSGKAGTMACWARYESPEGGGRRSGPLMTAGGGWWAPIWALTAEHACYAGDAGREKYAPGKSCLGSPWKGIRDGAWHHFALTWEHDRAVIYQDGQELGRAEYLYAEPRPAAPLVLGGSTLEGTQSSAFLDEAAVWQRALSAQEVRRLAAATQPIAQSLPALLLERPGRMIFHRGEPAAPLALTPLARGGAPRPVEATVDLPALGVSERIVIGAATPQTITVHPWKAWPGRYPLTVTSADGALQATGQIEIVASLPPPEFNMLAWESGDEIRPFGFTAELAGVEALETSLRRGLAASLRFDARVWHPLDPAHLAQSLEAAQATGRAAADYPHVHRCMINTEVGIGKPPTDAWFLQWMQQRTGLSSIPPEVRTDPLRIQSPADAPPLVPQDDQALRFVRWIEQEGKGWPTLNSRIADAMRREGLRSTVFYTDQPLSTADLEGLDSIDYWHYPHVPSGLIADFNRVCNIARLAGKKVSLMPGTIYWDPWPFRVDGKIVCLTPDMIRQYLWIAVAHPLDHLGLYGLGELRQGYVPEGTPAAIRQTLADVYPIGLLTGGLAQGPRPVAYLHTAGQLWQGPGDNQWIDFWFNRKATRALAEARLRYDWIGDEHVEAGWLKNYQAVVVPGAWRLPEEIHARLVAYAGAGGVVVVDKRCRAEIPGAVVLDYTSRGQQAEVVRAMSDWARQFRAARPEAIRLRDGDEAWLLDKLDGPARFVFLVNDRLVPGLLGADKQLQSDLGTGSGPLRDRGQAQRLRVTLPAAGGQAVYDLRAHRPLPLQDGAVDVDVGPGDAAVLAVLPELIGELRAAAPQAAAAGTEIPVKVSILATSGKPIGHRDVLEAKVTDAQGRELDVQRYFRVQGGQIEIPLRLALTQPAGAIKIELLEWIAGKTQTLTLTVQAPKEMRP